MNLSQVSRTAILTLITRVVASERATTLFNDPMASLCLEKLISLASEDERRWIINRKRFYGGISAHDALAGAQRSRAFDEAANQYIAANPGCTVVNLACGFDPRYWRIGHEHCRYFEVDLPEVIALKRELLKEHLNYEMIGCSVLDAAWIEQVTAGRHDHFLLLAEGLLMFLPKPEVIQLFQRLAQRLVNSQFVFDVVPEKYLHGVWKMLLRLESRINWQLDAAWVFGLNEPRAIETYAPGLSVLHSAKGSAGPIITVGIAA